MPTYSGPLMRDTLSDTGTVPSPGYPYSSPDLIGYDPLNPTEVQRFFSGNWSTDPNKPVQTGSKTNALYVRAKNLSSAELTGYYISVYRANTTLFLKPSQWTPNRLKTAGGASRVALPAMAAQAIGVGPEPFLIDGTVGAGLFCLVGMATNTPDPVLPPDFSNYSDYVMWVRNNQNVCGRNLSVLGSFPPRQWESWSSFENPETQQVPVLFTVSLQGSLPNGTTVGITCNPIGLQASWTWDPNVPTRTASAMCPPSWAGTVVTWATLPGGAGWPNGALLETEVYVGRNADDPVAMHATPWERLGVGPDEIDGLDAGGVLVRVGTVGTLLVSR